MAKLYNLAKMSTATTGTGTITLLAAVTGFLSFADAGVQDGDEISYAIRDGNEREVGRGVYTASGTTLTRSVITSTNSNAAINLSGNAQVFITALAEDFGSMFRLGRTSNTQLTADNLGTLIDITSGTFTQTFDAAATLGDGWFCYIRNSGTGDITLDPDGSETIDGLTSYVMYPGEVRLVQCDGTALRSIVLNAFYKTFTTSDTFIKPPGYSAFSGLLWGGGSSGAKEPTFVYGGPGGGCAPFRFSAADVSPTETVTIGAGGPAATGSTGNPGGNSTFKSVTAYGGAAPTTSTSTGGNAYLATVNNPTMNGAAGASASQAFYGGAGGGVIPGRSPTVWGGGAGAGISSSTPQPIFGATVFGGVGGASADSTNGEDGTAPGGGGGSTRTGTQSGAGARGELRIGGII